MDPHHSHTQFHYCCVLRGVHLSLPHLAISVHDEVPLEKIKAHLISGICHGFVSSCMIDALWQRGPGWHGLRYLPLNIF
jgi:hypothetical protein